MSQRHILLHPDPRLKKVAEPVGAVTDEIRALAADLLQTMYNAPGIGLAAPQVGVLKRLLVMDTAKGPDAAPKPMVMINPALTWISPELVVREEGCLSIPEHYADVERPASVRVRWTTLEGAETEEQFTGLAAACVQHEIDHLDGKLFIDYLRPLKRQMITRKMEKLKRELARG